MSVELTLLVWSTTLFCGYVGVQSLLYRMQHGIEFAGSARDDEAPPNLLNARAERALRNLIETYGVFVALAVATEFSGRSDGFTQWGAQLYFWGRWAYLPLYVAGIKYVRSMVWTVAASGLVLMFLGLVL